MDRTGWPIAQPKPLIEKWANSLRYFRFVGSSNSPWFDEEDRFLVAVHCDGKDELLRILTTLRTTPTSALVRTADQTGAFGDGSVQLGWVQMFGISVYTAIEGQLLKISVQGSSRDPDFNLNKVFLQAKALDSRIDALGLSVVDPPVEGKFCVSPRLYPELFLKKE